MEKLWGGRFEGTSQDWIDEFGASIHTDKEMVEEDIKGSMAHVKMLQKTAILSDEEAEEIHSGLETLQKKAQNQLLEFSVANEDIHLNIESMLHEEIGPVAGKIHTARSRNDQVATDIHLYLKKQIGIILSRLHELMKVIQKKSSEHVETILPGYTHLQHAQPISFAHHLMAYYHMFERDFQRLESCLERTDLSPLGSAALAGTTFPIDQEYTAELLGFSAVYENSIDAVSDRDFVVEFLSDSGLIMMHLSRFCEEIILWASHEFKYVTLSDTYSTGSSIMPQKKNPDMAELIRGKTGRVYGNLMALLTTLKGLPLAYNKDMQEDKEGMFDTVKTVGDSLKVFTGMLDTMEVHEKNMLAATQSDFSNATELADYLASKGVPFRKAHEIVGKLVLKASKENINLQDIPMHEYQSILSDVDESLYEMLESKKAVERRNSFNGTGFEQVKKQIDRAGSNLEARMAIKQH